jgi:alkylation response protein AidB-like acyl-CoA dehydrogenase
LSISARPTVPTDVIRAHAGAVDREARFPTEAVAALRASGLFGLAVPAAFGGLGAGPLEIAAVIEQISAACASTSMVFTMHVVATATLAAGTDTSDDGPRARTLRQIAAGDHLTTLAYSERGSRSHFWAQVSRAERVAGGVRIDADKSWVTTAGHCDSIVAAVGAPGHTDPLMTDIYLLDARDPGVCVLEPFDGLGMCGNASAPVALRGVVAGPERLIGTPAGGFGLMMSATLPWFVLGCAACCVGIAAEALRLAADHVGAARFEHLDETLADVQVVRTRLGEAQVRLLQARALLQQVAGQMAAADDDAGTSVLALKVAAAEMAIAVTDEAMRVCGGAAFSRHLPVERHFRDARAAAVMAPTTDVLRDLVGKAMTGRPLF